MKIKSFGCSFIFGTDLHDDGRHDPFPRPSKFTWPALLAQQLELGYSCYARGGSGNLQILEAVLNHAATNERDLFVIGWTWIDRFDYVDRDVGDQVKWCTIRPTSDDKTSDYYFRNIHSQYRDKLSSLIYIQTAIDVLTQKNIPFVMTCMDEIIFEKKWHATPTITDLQSRIEPCISTFDGNNFLGWSRDNGFEISATWHPLEAAHASAAELMLPVAQAAIKA